MSTEETQMNVVENSIIEFCEKKSKKNQTIYLFDICRHLKNKYGYASTESILIIDECIANESLEIREIEWKK